MTTVVEVINLALRDCSILGEGESATASLMSDAFDTFNQMLGLWEIDNLNVYAQVATSFAATGALTYSIGVGGDISIDRPDKIDYVYWRLNGLDIAATQLNSYEEYQGIVQKALASNPSYYFYLPSYPLGTLYLYPQPTNGTVSITQQVRLPTFVATNDTIVLPRQYVLPIRLSLAELFASLFSGKLPPEIKYLAERSRNTLRRSNVRINEMGMPIGIPTRHRGNILVGD